MSYCRQTAGPMISMFKSFALIPRLQLTLRFQLINDSELCMGMLKMLPGWLATLDNMRGVKVTFVMDAVRNWRWSIPNFRVFAAAMRDAEKRPVFISFSFVLLFRKMFTAWVSFKCHEKSFLGMFEKFPDGQIQVIPQIEGESFDLPDCSYNGPSSGYCARTL